MDARTRRGGTPTSTSRQAVASDRIIRSKLRPPEALDRVVARPRLERRLQELIAAVPVLAIYATPGSGKTTAAAEALRDDERLAWLTLDESDVAPGRLLMYLEAALAHPAPEADGVATGALRDGLGHAEAAGLLAESLEGRSIHLVLDEAENIADAPAAVRVLDAFLRYAPSSLRVVLISRRDLPLDGRAGGLAGGVRVVGGAELAFTTDEAAAALERLPDAPVAAAEAVAATDGWVTGVLFEAWRSAEHVVGTGGEVDPLHGYLSTQILGRLDEAERHLLVMTSPLRRVDPDSAARLGVPDAQAVLESLRRQHLPASWEPEGPAMLCHSRFREYLLELLHRCDADTVRRQRRRHGDLLLAWGQLEEATEEFFAAGATDEALATADLSIEGVIDRLDLDVAGRWLDRVPPDELARHPGLLTGQLMLALGREEYGRGHAPAVALLEGPHADELPVRTLSLMAWCLWVAGDPERAREVEARMPPGPERRIIRYQQTSGNNDATPERETPPEPTGTPLDAILMRTSYITGRLRAVRDAPPMRWSSAVIAPWRADAARAMGRLDQAHDDVRAALAADFVSPRVEGIVLPHVLADLGRVDDALATLLEARPRGGQSGSVIWEFQSLLLEAWIRLRYDVDREHATAVLAGLAARPEMTHYAFLAEELLALTGLALLLAGDRDADARRKLDEAVDSMVTGCRILTLPASAVWLAEACWRLGDEEASDAAADLALDAAQRQGAQHTLLQALSDFPAVLVRRLDAEPTADSPWHDLGRVLAARSVALDRPLDHQVRFHDLGAPRVVVDGEVVRPKITKSLEILAYLAEAEDHCARRDDLMQAVFDGRSDHSARTYLRQALHKLRELLPAGTELMLDGDRVELAGVTIVTDSARFQRMLDEAARLGDSERLEALEAALKLYETGEYLAGRDSNWIDQRRGELEGRATDARFAVAELLFARSDLGAAQAHLDAALSADPYRERTWRLAMRVAAAYGDDDRVVSVFRRCERALAELGIAPAPSTHRLLDDLRR